MATLTIRCAPAGLGAGTNLGMNTVDLAAHSIIRERGHLGRVRLVRPWGAYDSRAPGYRQETRDTDIWPMDFHPTTLLDPAAPDGPVLYWGDFQHGWDYQRQSARRLMKACALQGMSVGLDQCLDWCMRHFMLEGVRPAGVACYGGTLFQNRMGDYEDPRYLASLAALYRSADFIRVRDPYSAWQVSNIRDDFGRQFLGPDAAMLNLPEDIRGLQQASPAELSSFDGAVGIYFGRSERGFPWFGASRFIAGLADRLGADVAWIPWDRHAGGLFAPINHVLSWTLPGLRKVPEGVEMTPGDTLNGLRRFQLVVTDTYHLAINCLIQGIPAVCIHEPSPRSLRNANMGFREAMRDKRALLYMTHDLTELLVPSTDLQSRAHRALRAETVVALIRQRAALARSLAALARYAAQARAAVGDHIDAAVRGS